MKTQRSLVWLSALLVVLSTLSTVGQASAQEQPRRGGVLTWLEYADPGRLDLHTESPLSVLQAVAGIYSGLLQYGPDDPDTWGPIWPSAGTLLPTVWNTPFTCAAA